VSLSGAVPASIRPCVKEPTIGGAQKHRWSSIICTGGLRVLDRSGRQVW